MTVLSVAWVLLELSLSFASPHLLFLLPSMNQSGLEVKERQ